MTKNKNRRLVIETQLFRAHLTLVFCTYYTIFYLSGSIYVQLIE